MNSLTVSTDTFVSAAGSDTTAGSLRGPVGSAERLANLPIFLEAARFVVVVPNNLEWPWGGAVK